MNLLAGAKIGGTASNVNIHRIFMPSVIWGDLLQFIGAQHTLYFYNVVTKRTTKRALCKRRQMHFLPTV